MAANNDITAADLFRQHFILEEQRAKARIAASLGSTDNAPQAQPARVGRPTRPLPKVPEPKKDSAEDLPKMSEASFREMLMKHQQEHGDKVSPLIRKLMSIVKFGEDEKKQTVKENVDQAKKNIEQVSELNDSLSKILVAQVKTTGLLKELLQTVKDTKEEENKQQKSWFRRLVDAAVGAVNVGIGVGGMAMLGYAAMNRAEEISTTERPAAPPAPTPEPAPAPAPQARPRQQTPAPQPAAPQQRSEPQTPTPRQHSERREEPAATPQPAQEVAEAVPASMPARAIPVSANQNVESGGEKTTVSAPVQNQGGPKSSPQPARISVTPATARPQTPTNIGEADATPVFEDEAPNTTPSAVDARRQSAEPVLRDLPTTMRDHTFKANEIRFKADEFKFEQSAIPIMGAADAGSAPAGPSVIPASMPIPQPQVGAAAPGGGSRGGGGREGTLEQLDPAIRSIYERLRSEFPGLSHTSTTEGRLGVAGQAAHGEGKAIDLNMAGLDEAARRRLVTAVANIPEVTGIGMYPTTRPNMLHVDSGYTGGRRRGASRMAWGDDGSRSSLPQTPEWFQSIVNPWMGGGAATRVQAASAAGGGAAAPSSGEMTAAPPAAPVPAPPPQTGSALAAASAQRSMAADLPPAPTPAIVQSSAPDDDTPAPAGFGGQQYPLDPNNPGTVEPHDAIERYSRLFDMHAVR